MVVVNSLDGRDIVSGVYYGAVKSDEVLFLTPAYTEQLAYNKIGTDKDIILIQSARQPILTGMEAKLKEKGNGVEVVLSEEPFATNLELAGKSGAKSFVLVDSVYGYNTVSALAYAKLNSMYLIFTDKDNALEVAAFLKGKQPSQLLIYGYTDNEVNTALHDAGLSHTEINNGDKFDDNLELLDMYFAENPSKKQAILSDGNAFEITIVAGEDPVVLISTIVPTAVYDYIKAKAAAGQIKAAMVVDGAYSQTAYNLKTSINKELGSDALSVFVKIGEGGSGDQMMPVQLFPLPGPTIGLKISKAEYNQVKKELEITYENTGNALEYVDSRIMVFVDGTYVATVGDDVPFALEKGKKYGKGYALEVQSGEIVTNITSYYGSSKKSHESGIQLMMPAGRVDFVDASVLAISDFNHDKSTNDLLVSFANGGTETVYLRPYATIDLNGTKTRITDDNVYSLGANEGRVVRFPGIVKAGSTIMAGADYGSREAFLEKNVEKEFVPAAEAANGPDIVMMALAGVVVVLLLVVAYFAWDKMSKGKTKK